MERPQILIDDDDEFKNIWEMGIDGVILTNKTSGKTEVGVFPGAVAYTRAYRLRADVTTLHHKMGELRPGKVRQPSAQDPHAPLHGSPRAGLYPLSRCRLSSRGRRSRRAPIQPPDDGEWYLANLAPGMDFTRQMNYAPGQVLYKFWPAENRFSSDYNLVRHTLATWNLAQAWTLDPRPEFLEGARSALDWTLSFRKDEGDMSYIEYNNNRKLGAVVLAMMGMIELAKAEETDEYDELLERFGNFTLFMQEDSGRFDPYYVDDDHPYADAVNDIVPGEASGPGHAPRVHRRGQVDRLAGQLL